MHVGSPVAHPDRVRQTLAEHGRAFAVVTPFLTAVPLYGGTWMMACCSASLDPCSLQASDVDLRIAQRGIGDLQFMNGDTYRAVLALPNDVRPLAR